MSDERERELQQAIREAGLEKIAYQFVTRHAAGPNVYIPCQSNMQILSEWLDVNELDVSLENLEAAYQECKSRLVHDTKPTLDDPAPAKPVAKITVTELAPDGQPYPAVPAGCSWPRSRKAILALDPGTYRSLYHSKRYGPEFRAYVDEIMQRGI